MTRHPFASSLLAISLMVGAGASHAAKTVWEAGQASFQSKCAICHHAQADAGHAVGPNLAGVVGRRVASAPGFAYSEALVKHAGDWQPERLLAFLQSPQQAVPGTVMPFAGLKSATDRKAIVCFLSGAPAGPLCQ